MRIMEYRVLYLLLGRWSFCDIHLVIESLSVEISFGCSIWQEGDFEGLVQRWYIEYTRIKLPSYDLVSVWFLCDKLLFSPPVSQQILSFLPSPYTKSASMFKTPDKTP